MFKLIKALGAAALLAITMASPVAHAVIIKGPYAFDDNAFADAVTGSGGTFTPVGGTLEEVMTDAALDTGISGGSSFFLDLAFLDNAAINNAGADLVIFEASAAQDLTVTINGFSLLLNIVSLGFSEGGIAVNGAEIELDDFGVAAGAMISSLRVGTPVSGADPTDVGVLNNVSIGVPVPATLGLLALGLLGLRVRRAA